MKYKEIGFSEPNDYDTCFENWYDYRSRGCNPEPASVKMALENAYREGMEEGRRKQKRKMFWDGLSEADQERCRKEWREYHRIISSIEVEVKTKAFFEKPEKKNP